MVNNNEDMINFGAALIVPESFEEALTYEQQIQYLEENKQDKLTAGEGIHIDENNVITAEGGGGGGHRYEMEKVDDNNYKLMDKTASTQAGATIVIPDQHYDDTEVKASIEAVASSVNGVKSDLAVTEGRVSELQSDVSELADIVDSVETDIENLDNRKMEYYILNYVVSTRKIVHDGQEVSYEDVRSLCLDDKHFVYLLYRNHIYIPAQIDSSIRFESTYVYNGLPSIHYIHYNSDGTIDVGNDNLQYKLTAGENITIEGNTISAQGQTGPKGDPGNGIKNIYYTTAEDGTTVDFLLDDDAHKYVFVERGEKGADGQKGQDGHNGADGFSPIVSVNKTDNVTTLSVTDKEGAQSIAYIYDGQKGADGQRGLPGFSPVVDIIEGSGEHTVKIIDETETHTFIVKDGEKGQKGDKGDTGERGPEGPSGSGNFEEVTGDDDTAKLNSVKAILAAGKIPYLIHGTVESGFDTSNVVLNYVGKTELSGMTIYIFEDKLEAAAVMDVPGVGGVITYTPQAEKQDKLTAGENITIENNVISAAGGGGEESLVEINVDEITVDELNAIVAENKVPYFIENGYVYIRFYGYISGTRVYNYFISFDGSNEKIYTVVNSTGSGVHTKSLTTKGLSLSCSVSTSNFVKSEKFSGLSTSTLGDRVLELKMSKVTTKVAGNDLKLVIRNMDSNDNSLLQGGLFLENKPSSVPQDPDMIYYGFSMANPNVNSYYKTFYVDTYDSVACKDIMSALRVYDSSSSNYGSKSIKCGELDVFGSNDYVTNVKTLTQIGTCSVHVCFYKGKTYDSYSPNVYQMSIVLKFSFNLSSQSYTNLVMF